MHQQLKSIQFFCATLVWVLEIAHVGELYRPTSAATRGFAASDETGNVTSLVCTEFFRK